MRINWKLRFQNKTTLAAIISIAISIVYKVLDLCGIVPPFEQDRLVDIGLLILDILCLLGIITDPTTDGTSDSMRALTYKEPYADTIDAKALAEKYGEVDEVDSESEVGEVDSDSEDDHEL